jgi:prepilin-type N-terminal cleavage/methylation domain-containing protein
MPVRAPLDNESPVKVRLIYMKHYLPAERRGFTLIELLVVIGILAILLAITLIAINPARQFSQANDTKRRSDVNAILNAVGQYMADNHGGLPADMPAADVVETIGGTTASQANICADIVPLYLAALPVDPLTDNGTPVTEADCATAYDTNYTITVSGTDNRITVSAPATELATTDITVTR